MSVFCEKRRLVLGKNALPTPSFCGNLEMQRQKIASGLRIQVHFMKARYHRKHFAKVSPLRVSVAFNFRKDQFSIPN
ncbi:MAG TPA: hypothetical protein DCS93_39335 [Microscillaceae bacterium]|nr:hypothetical protein [Microscillaceae bacterium]